MVAILGGKRGGKKRKLFERTRMAGVSVRWAVSLRQTESLPHFELLFRQALQSLTIEDIEAQRRFRYRDDSLACIVGRLLIRRAFGEVGVAWHDAKQRIRRTDRGKPIDAAGELKFNVSHQGDLVVLAGTSNAADEAIGVDVMRIDEDVNGGAKGRIERLRRAFTPRERETMLKWTEERDRWRSFYRHWCLKEAVLKTTGVGISEDLGKLEFWLEEEVQGDAVISSTRYLQDGVPQPRFVFEESNIGDDHVVAVGRITENEIASPDPRFTVVDLPFLLEPSSIEEHLEDGGAEEFATFDAKQWKHF